MTSAYPGALDALKTGIDGNTDTLASVPHDALHNDANAAIVAVQATLGVNPQGDYATVDERVSDLAARSRSVAYGTQPTDPQVGDVWISGPTLSPQGFEFVIVGAKGGLATSPDGITWTMQSSGFGTADIYSVAWSIELGLFVATGNTTSLETSPDGVTWTTWSSGVYGEFVGWFPGLALFIVSGAFGGLVTSPDGVTWTQRSLGFGTSDITAVVWSDSLSLLVAVGEGGKLSTSPDGVTWTPQPPIPTSGEAISTIAWSPTLELFVAAGAQGMLFTSPDALSWTAQFSGLGTAYIYAAIWVPELSVFVAGANYSQVATSPDGATWTVHDAGFGSAYPINTVAWSAALSLLVVGSNSGRLATSPDGVTWTARTSGFGASAVKGVAWADVNTISEPPYLHVYDREQWIQVGA